jgi:hypothetical protein
MASIVYPLLLFLFIFGAASTFLNSTGLYEHTLPTSGLNSNTTEATTFNSAIQNAASDSTSYNYQTIFMMGQCIAGGITTIVTLGPLLISYGVPESMAAYAISPLGIILLFWVVEMIFARYQE